MGNQALLGCCVRREDGTSRCCEFNTSVLGEDAYYREAFAFYDCEEGTRAPDSVLDQAREQAGLKLHKGSLAVRYASYELKRTTSEPVASALKVCGVKREVTEQTAYSSACSQHCAARSPKWQRMDEADFMQSPDSWLGRTLNEWTADKLPQACHDPSWARGKGKDLQVRCGPDYKANGRKVESAGAMYHALSLDAIKANVKIDNVISKLLKGKLPKAPNGVAESERGGGASLQWKPGCDLPRILCINLMLPYTRGLNPLRQDGGCSMVGVFHITPETIKAAASADPPPHIRLFKDFCQGPCGSPDGQANDPDRSLGKRVVGGRKKDQQSGLLKVIAKCENPEDVPAIPEMLYDYNGKPCLITKCGYVLKDPEGEWLELGVDVRGFNVLARQMLCQYRQVLPRTKIHYGFLIQGFEDEELPEGLLCDMYGLGIDMMEDPLDISSVWSGS